MTEQDRAEEAQAFDAAIEEGEIGQELVAMQEGVLTTSPLDMPVELFKESLDRRKANRDAMMEWIKESLVEGTDFGRIHFIKKAICSLGADCKNPKHFAKPSLFKPGSEKILGMLGITINWPALSQYEQMALDGKPIKDIILRCEAISASGEIVAEGMGARSVTQDSGDLNKALKMAKKSGMIDMTLTLGGLSEIFTQDIEDMVKATTPTPEEAASNLPPVPEGTETKAPKPETPGKTDFEKRLQLKGYLGEITGININNPVLLEHEKKRLSAELVELTKFDEKPEGEGSLRNLKGAWLNTAIGRAKAKLGLATSKDELLQLLKDPILLKVLDRKRIDEFIKDAEDKRHKEQWYLDQLPVIKGFIADAEKEREKQETLKIGE